MAAASGTSSSGPKASPAPSAVAVLGVGRMGAAIAERLVAGGFRPSAWNRTARHPGGTVSGVEVTTDSPSEVAAGADVVLTCLTDGAALCDVLLDRHVLEAMAGRTLIDCSTVDLASSHRIEEACDTYGIGYVRAPISGNPEVVRSGSATALVSGPSSALSAAEPVISSIAGRHLVLGDRDEARVVKLAINLLLAGTAELLAEAVLLAESQAVDREVLLDALNASVVGSAFTRYKTPALLERNYHATFATTDLAKDVGIAVGEAQRKQLSLPLTQRVAELLATASSLGYGQLDFMSLLPALQKLSNRPADVGEPAPS